MASPNHQVLNLDTLTNRPVVVIDSREYELLTRELLPPIDAHRMVRMYARQEELLGAAIVRDLTDEEQTELEGLPDRMCRLVLEAPEDVHAKLTAKQRQAVVAAFSMGLAMLMPPATSPNQASPSIGASSSRG